MTTQPALVAKVKEAQADDKEVNIVQEAQGWTLDSDAILSLGAELMF